MVMAGAIAEVLGLALKGRAEVDSTQKLLLEIEAVKRGLDAVAGRFEFQSDPDLVEACIYEMQALAARYRYLTREARRNGITKDTVLVLKRL
jgi:hypothetical protein